MSLWMSSRKEIDAEAMALSEKEWTRLHEWFFSDTPLHKGLLGDISKTGLSDYAVAYAEWADARGRINGFRAGDTDTLTVHGKTFTL